MPAKKRSTRRTGNKRSARTAGDRLTTESNVPEAHGLVVSKTRIKYGSEGKDVSAARASPSRSDPAEGRLHAMAASSLARSTAVGTEMQDGVSVVASSATPLPDIATFSDAMPFAEVAVRARSELVIGRDDRIRVNETSRYPWRAIASLIITTRNGLVGVGTGWFISPRTLITAGHCVFIQSRNPALHGWVRRIVVMPGRDGALTPFGASTALEFKSVRGWTRYADQGYDYGAIILPNSHSVGNNVGTFGVGAFSDTDLENLKVNVSGYPDDKVADERGTQWFHAQAVVGVRRRSLEYLADTMGGQSGSPVFCLRDDQYVTVAIHAYGGNSSNSGTRITPEVLEAFEDWKP